MQLPADAAVALPAAAHEWAALSDGDHSVLLDAWGDDVLVDVHDAHIRRALPDLDYVDVDGQLHLPLHVLEFFYACRTSCYLRRD